MSYETFAAPGMISSEFQQPPVGQGLLIFEASRSHSDTSHSVGLLWMREGSVAESSTWQHTTFTRDRHPCPLWDSNPQSQQASGRRLTPRPRGHSVQFRATLILWTLCPLTQPTLVHIDVCLHWTAIHPLQQRKGQICGNTYTIFPNTMSC
jgi:hypothetical protein